MLRNRRHPQARTKFSPSTMTLFFLRSTRLTVPICPLSLPALITTCRRPSHVFDQHHHPRDLLPSCTFSDPLHTLSPRKIFQVRFVASSSCFALRVLVSIASNPNPNGGTTSWIFQLWGLASFCAFQSIPSVDPNDWKEPKGATSYEPRHFASNPRDRRRSTTVHAHVADTAPQNEASRRGKRREVLIELSRFSLWRKWNER